MCINSHCRTSLTYQGTYVVVVSVNSNIVCFPLFSAGLLPLTPPNIQLATM